jgi:hypothetical protein
MVKQMSHLSFLARDGGGMMYGDLRVGDLYVNPHINQAWLIIDIKQTSMLWHRMWGDQIEGVNVEVLYYDYTFVSTHILVLRNGINVNVQ